MTLQTSKNDSKNLRTRLPPESDFGAMRTDLLHLMDPRLRGLGVTEIARRSLPSRLGEVYQQ